LRRAKGNIPKKHYRQKDPKKGLLLMAKAVVFDLDGTLVDSAADLKTAINKLLSEEGRRALALDEVAEMIGDGAMKLVERAFRATGGRDEAESPERLTARFLAFYAGHATDLTRPYPGVPETLALLREQQWALGICTNKPEQATREVLRGLDLDRYFGAVVGGDSIAGVRKPDPRLLLAAIERLGAAPAEAVMVGDNANDVQSARAARVPVIVRAGGYTRVPAPDLGADAVIAAFAELPAALAEVSARCRQAI
jgi:phosphoglycolate phosphatase